MEVIKKAYLQGEVEFEDSDDDDDDGKEDEDGEDHAASPRNVGHNIYILAHQVTCCSRTLPWQGMKHFRLCQCSLLLTELLFSPVLVLINSQLH